MKKFLITVSPICIVLFVSIWISWGLKGAVTFFVAVIFIVVLAVLLAKWMEFVDKHIKD